MRVHVQNGPHDKAPVTPAEWAEAGGAGHDVSFGDTPEQFRAAMEVAEVLVLNAGTLRRLLPLRAPRLRVVFFLNAGLDTMRPFDWVPPGVVLLNNSGTHADKAAEYILMALLMMANGLPGFIADQHARRWDRRPGLRLAGRRLLVAGLGAIGEATATLAAAAGVVVTGIRTSAGHHPACRSVHAMDELDRLLGETDYLALALPLTERTRHVLDRRRLALLPPGAGVVNVGRGGLVEQDALCDALRAGALGGAVLDVFEEEPVPPDAAIWTTPNLVMTPHMSAEDPERYNLLSLRILFRNLRQDAAGQPMDNLVGIERGY